MRRNSTAQVQEGTLRRRVAAVFSDVKIDTPELAAALKGLSALSGDPSSSASSSASSLSSSSIADWDKASYVLRSQLELRGACELDQSIVEAARAVEREVAKVETSVAQMSQTCAAIAARLDQACQGASATLLLAQAQELKRQELVARARRDAVDAFLAAFRVSPEELQVIARASSSFGTDANSGGSAVVPSPTTPSPAAAASSSSSPIGPAFFKALARVVAVRSECAQLLQTPFQRIALELMSSLGEYMERGYETLYKWVQRASVVVPASSSSSSSSSSAALTGLAGLATVADISPTLVTSLRLLRKMPVYYNHCVDEILQARRLAYVQQFIEVRFFCRCRCRCASFRSCVCVYPVCCMLYAVCVCI